MNIANRNTISKKIPEIDSLYVYSTRHKAKFTHRQQLGEGYRYSNHHALLKAGEGEIHIYHRTATVKDITKGITMVTKNGKFRDVQKWFKEQVTLIEENDKLFDKFKTAKYSPTELGIYYNY